MAKEKKVVKESKKDRFVRLANKRVNSALAKIDLIGNLAGANYESTPAQVERIEKVLVASVMDVISVLKRPAAKAKEDFTL